MSMLDLSKTQYTSLFQGLGNLPPLGYEFDIPQIDASRTGGPLPTPYSWTIPSSSYEFTMPIERSDLLTSLLFSIRDVAGDLNGGRHSWATSILDSGGTSTTTDEYLSRFESMRSVYETRIAPIEIVGFPSNPVFDYFQLRHYGMNYPSSGNFPLLSLRSHIRDDNLILSVSITGGEIGTSEEGPNTPTTKAIAAAKLRVIIKRYIAPWNT